MKNIFLIGTILSYIVFYPRLDAVPPNDCKLLIYNNVTHDPEIRSDTHDICPEENGPRAFVPAILSQFMTHDRIAPIAQSSSVYQLKEVSPDPFQNFNCLNLTRCYLIVRGYWLTGYDTIAVLPQGYTKCPPEDYKKQSDSSSAQQSSDNQPIDTPIIVQGSQIARLTNPKYSNYEAWITAFEMPDRFILSSGAHKVCYSPYLASRIKDPNLLQPSHFHYDAGILSLQEKVFSCDFEEAMIHGTYNTTERFLSKLPCGFRNFQDRLNIGLQWQLNRGHTDTPGTGPSGDATTPLGDGYYVYMDAPGFASGATATLVGPPLAMNPGEYCTQFSYSMYGPDVSSFRVYLHSLNMKTSRLKETNISMEQTDHHNMLGAWGSPRWVTVGNKGDAWHQGGFEFKVRDRMEVYQLVFEAVSGESEQGDIAVDDISITPGACPLDVRTHNPHSIGNKGQPHQPMICGEVRLVTGLHAEDKSWRVEKAVSCAGRGYSVNQMKNSFWLPCCVPHFGAYSLILEDKLGDGWEGSRLEFRFFDKVMVFGNDTEFKKAGFDRTYTLVIGSFEILGVSYPENRKLAVSVRVARPNSYLWCGVAKLSSDGTTPPISLTPALLKKYGARSTKPTVDPNEIVNVTILKPLELYASYDLYCYSEVIEAMLDANMSKLYDEDKISREIVASRLRLTVDSTPPSIMTTSLYSTYNSINVTLVCDESAQIWCLAEKAPPRSDPFDFVDPLPLFSLEGALSGALEDPNVQLATQRVAKYFYQRGSTVVVSVNRNQTDTSNHGVTTHLIIGGLIPATEYDVLCYAEDDSTPIKNSMTPIQVQDTARPTKTESKIPTVYIHHHLTLLRGFRLELSLDAPGQVWCAASPEGYTDPSVLKVIEAGAYTNTTDAFQKIFIDIHGVEPNTAYKIYCAAGDLAVTNPQQTLHQITTQDEMKSSAISVMSYGAYCQTEHSHNPSHSTDQIVTTDYELSPFHPIRIEEEIKVRNFILSRPELNLQGLYRINLLPNKTEIYDYYDNHGPKPLRYARVRAGRCVDNIGYYEQFRVGPLNAPASNQLQYKRLSRAIETECGGYNPQGVFGRLLGSTDNSDSLIPDDYEETIQKFYLFMNNSFGYKFPGIDASCVSETLTNKSSTVETSRNKHKNSYPCLEYGPVLLEEVCEGNITNSSCQTGQRQGRVWLGLKTPMGDQLPFYFIYDLLETNSHKTSTTQQETAHEWATRIVQNRELPIDFHRIWSAKMLWYLGEFYSSIPNLLETIDSDTNLGFTPEKFKRYRETVLESRDIHKRTLKRHLAPSPYPGAAGTAGPVPLRKTKRVGLEYLAHPEHIETQGSRFRIKASTDMESYSIDYLGWTMTMINDRDTGLRLYNIRFLGKRIAFEMGVMEALAHYTVSERNWFFLDSWYGGLGSAARHVHRGIECPKTGVTVFWDGSLCIFEQDLARPLRAHWRGGELRLGAPHLVLVLRQMITVSNYDYVTDYRFHATGMIDASVSFTGELYAGVEVPWYSNRQHDYGTQVTGAMRFAALHSHVLSWKIDFDIGEEDNWKKNSVLLTEVIQDPNRPEANKLVRRFAERERDASYFRNDTRPMTYEIVDETIDMFGNVGGYRIHPYEGMNPYNHNSSLYSGPAAWAKYRIASTVRKYSELDITLPRDNKFAHRPAVTLDRYIQDDEPIRHVDVVTWISDGIFHIPVTEDMPLTIPVGNTLGWLVRPANLFMEDPSMDLYNAQGGGVKDPGTCAVVRMSIGDVEPTLNKTWTNIDAMFSL